MEDIYIIGAGGLAKEIHFLIRQTGLFNPVAFIDIKESTICISGINYPVITETVFEKLNAVNLAIGVGDPKLIAKVIGKFKGKFNFPNIIHPSVIADWNNIEIGDGNIITAGVILTTNVFIGSFNVFNLNSTVGHDVVIGNCNVINPGANISGGVKISNNVLVGSNSTILQYLEIGEGSIIGASSLVNKNVELNTIVVGVPAKSLIRR